ncbi:uncharacterized protein LOC141587813 [Silene latifolia]|uniref:uncharacterized protein LOC141587813 n=1 Tax=Silene latifolia TaxID=37657 RepID=UPI003D78A500
MSVHLKKSLNELRKAMMKEFEMTDLGKLQYFLGLEVNRIKKVSRVSEEVCKRFIKKLIGGFEIAITPMNANEKCRGKMALVFARPTKQRSRSCKEDFKVHCRREKGIGYETSRFDLVGFTDKDWAGSLDDEKEYIGSVFMLGSQCYYMEFKEAGHE